jgi:pimeloyl-ACP methyl ester carboxylesterase
MATTGFHRPAAGRGGPSSGCLILFPGTASPPWHYDDLLLALGDSIGVEPLGFCPSGIGDRKLETGARGPAALAAEALEETHGRAGPRIWVGHSWGGHAARAAALDDDDASALVLIDPNLGHSGPPDPARFDPPGRFEGREALIDLYREHGIPEEHIVWASWETAKDGSLVPIYDADAIREHIAATPWGPRVIDEIHAASTRMPVAVVRPGALTINRPEAWDDLRRRAPEARILDAPEAHHVLPVGEQAAVARGIAAWLGER